MISPAIASIVLMQIGGRMYDRFRSVKCYYRYCTSRSGSILALYGFIWQRKGNHNCRNDLSRIRPCIICYVFERLRYERAPQGLINRVTSLNNASQQVVGSFAVAVFSTLLTTRISASSHSVPKIDAWADAFSSTFLVVMAVAALGVVMGLLLSKPSEQVDKPIDQPTA